MCICIYIYIYIHSYISVPYPAVCWPTALLAACRRRENMVGVNIVGVNMVLHDSICECFEGAMLDTCLLKPCFHVAGYVKPQRTTIHTRIVRMIVLIIDAPA